jgi:hypothetical protein
MVAVAPTNATQPTLSTKDGQQKVLSAKQKQRLEEQKAREAKKVARRSERQAQKERRALEKERKDAERERRLEEMNQLTGEGLTYKEAEEQQRLEEEKAMLEAEFIDERPPVQPRHVKKSVTESNRLGGHSMA